MLHPARTGADLAAGGAGARGDGFAFGAAFLRGVAGAGGGFPCADVGRGRGKISPPRPLGGYEGGMFGWGWMRDERGMRERRLRGEFRKRLRLRERNHGKEDHAIHRGEAGSYASQFLAAYERPSESREPRITLAAKCHSARAARPARKPRPAPAVATAARRAPPRTAAKPDAAGRNPAKRGAAKRSATKRGAIKCPFGEWTPGKCRRAEWRATERRATERCAVADCRSPHSRHARRSGNAECTARPDDAASDGSARKSRACRSGGKVNAGFGACGKSQRCNGEHSHPGWAASGHSARCHRACRQAARGQHGLGSPCSTAVRTFFNMLSAITSRMNRNSPLCGNDWRMRTTCWNSAKRNALRKARSPSRSRR